MNPPTLPDTAAIRALRQWLTPRVTMDPAQGVLSLLQALGEAGYAVRPTGELAATESRIREECARLAECREVDGSWTWLDGPQIAAAIREGATS